jgi:hypothetical protein
MTTYTEPGRALDFLISEAPGTLSRDTVTLAAGTGTVLAGTVLGALVSGKYAAFDEDDSSDGPSTASAILCYDTDITADATATVISRLAEVDGNLLVWASANDAGDKTAGITELASQFIVVR